MRNAKQKGETIQFLLCIQMNGSVVYLVYACVPFDSFIGLIYSCKMTQKEKSNNNIVNNVMCLP